MARGVARPSAADLPDQATEPRNDELRGFGLRLRFEAQTRRYSQGSAGNQPHPSPRRGNPLLAQRIARATVPLAATLAVGAAVFDLAAGALACGSDSADCVRRDAKDTVYTASFAAAGDGAPVDVVVLGRSRQPLTVRTGPRGRLCFVWAEEDVLPTATARGRTVVVHRLRRLASRAVPPLGCPTLGAAIPWTRTHELHSSWQWLAILAVAASAVLVLLASALAAGPRARRLHALGVVAGPGAALLCALLWLNAG